MKTSVVRLVGVGVTLVAAGFAVGCSGSDAGSAGGTGGSTLSGSGGAATSGSGGAVQPGSGGSFSTGGSQGTGGSGTTGTGGGSGGVAPATGGGGPAQTGGSDSGTGGLKATGGMNAGGKGGGVVAGTGGAAGGGSGNLKAFLVITSKGTPTPGDMLMIGRIMAHGFQTVTPVTDAAVTAQSVAGADLVVISSSAESGPLQSKLRDIAIPCMVIEDAEFSKMGMAMSGDHDSGVSAVTIVPAGSALIGTATGMVTIAAKAGELGWAAGTNAATVVIGATMPGNTAHAAIFGYPKGAMMSGMAAPARRAGFAIREALAAGLNADGIKLFDSILEWVLQ